jgi:hypothetical protein
MKNTLLYLSLLLLWTASGCKKDTFNFASTSHPDIPVTVANLYGVYNGVPTIATSLASGTITIGLSIPASSGRTIREITRVGVASTPSNYKVVEQGSGLYNTAPIAGSGTSVTFTTSLSEYTAKTGLSVTSGGTATSFLGRYFYFLITLDNGDQLLPVPVRIYVTN